MLTQPSVQAQRGISEEPERCIVPKGVFPHYIPWVNYEHQTNVK